MSKQFRNWPVFLTLAMVTLGIIPSCQLSSFIGDVKVAEISNSEGYYTINPDSILASLAQGNANLFTPQIAPPDASPSISDKLVQWSQAEYFQIARALHQFVWNEPMENWNLGYMGFRMDCTEVNSGPQFARFEIFKISRVREQESRFVRNIYIEPLKKSASWHETEYYPNVGASESIDLARLKISAQNALQIAEKNGGAEAREAVENACIINLSLAPGAEYDGWRIGYTGSDRKDLFVIRIDPLTGEYGIVK